MHIKYVYPKGLMDALYNPGILERSLKIITGALLIFFLGAWAIFATIAAASLNLNILAVLAICPLAIYAILGSTFMRDHQGIEISDKKIRLISFFIFGYRRPITGVERVTYDPKINARANAIMKQHNLRAMRLYFWDWADKGAQMKIYLPTIVFLPVNQYESVKALFSKVSAPEKELKEILGED